MTSALFSLVNATAKFVVAGQGVTTDPETGNVLPVQETMEYKLFLKATAVDPTVYPGVDADVTIYEGYVVDPTQLDARIGVGSTGKLTFGTAQPVPFEVLRGRMGYGDKGVLGERLSETLGTKIALMAQG